MRVEVRFYTSVEVIWASLHADTWSWVVGGVRIG